jgi:hypothetical protein
MSAIVQLILGRRRRDKKDEAEGSQAGEEEDPSAPKSPASVPHKDAHLDEVIHGINVCFAWWRCVLHKVLAHLDEVCVLHKSSHTWEFSCVYW